jgi:Zn-dependent M16 (insulinase) family peptidase
MAKLLQDLPRRKRSANSAGSSTMFDMLFDKSKSPSIANGLLATLTSFPRIADELKETPEAVIKKLKTLREYLLDPAVMRISVAGDILSMSHPRSAFSDNFLPFNVSLMSCRKWAAVSHVQLEPFTANRPATPQDR